ncbi:MAG: Flp pilus assembly complex ATPase component TadA [Oligoflexales bacterium]|nr:Flp pilus assembly complex ATPase component TadA [Oligoflexales bacterium]
MTLSTSQTGHLVLSTLYTNDATRVIGRLTGISVNASTLAENLLFISAKRLAPLLCPFCREEENGLYVRSRGCSEYEGQGLKSRRIIIEYS